MRSESQNAAAATVAEVAASNFSDSFASDDYDDTDDGMELEDPYGNYEQPLKTQNHGDYTLEDYQARAKLAAEFFPPEQFQYRGPDGRTTETSTPSERKRSSEDVDDYEDEELSYEEEDSTSIQGDYAENVSSNERAWMSPRRESSPISMKRIKLTEAKDDGVRGKLGSSTPTRKRSSEEMESESGVDCGNDEGANVVQDVAHKKVRSQE